MRLRAKAEAIAGGDGLTASQLPHRWIKWLLQVEDPAFKSHHGVDFTSRGAGWTTLTQGLVKLHFPGPNRGPLGKPLQIIRALVLDSVVSKNDQLTLILNTAYFGIGSSGPVVGFPSAAHEYYSRRLNELSDTEYLGLVGMLVGPNRFHPTRRPREHAERVHRIEALIAGRCRPSSWQDVYLSQCDQ